MEFLGELGFRREALRTGVFSFPNSLYSYLIFFLTFFFVRDLLGSPTHLTLAKRRFLFVRIILCCTTNIWRLPRSAWRC